MYIQDRFNLYVFKNQVVTYIFLILVCISTHVYTVLVLGIYEIKMKIEMKLKSHVKWLKLFLK